MRVSKLVFLLSAQLPERTNLQEQQVGRLPRHIKSNLTDTLLISSPHPQTSSRPIGSSLIARNRNPHLDHHQSTSLGQTLLSLGTIKIGNQDKLEYKSCIDEECFIAIQEEDHLPLATFNKLKFNNTPNMLAFAQHRTRKQNTSKLTKLNPSS